MDLIADTNIWYDISAKLIDVDKLKENGCKLIATPISLLEITSKLSIKTFTERKYAAQSVILYADEIASDTETHLSKIWGINNPSSTSINWKLGFQVISEASSFKEIEEGIYDFANNEIRRINTNLVLVWRDYHWNDFVKKVEEAIEPYIPNYNESRLTGKVKYLNTEKAKIFSEAILSQECQEVLYKATFLRVILCNNLNPQTIPTNEQNSYAKTVLTPYIEAYSKYLIKCSTQFMPHHNDFGDLECFIYLQDNNMIFTKDKRWLSIAQEVCPNLVFNA
jgi:hypothetical protein